MSAVSWCVGAVFGVAGAGKVLDLVDKTDFYLKNGQAEETRGQKISRLAVNALRMMSQFAIAIGSLSLAHALISIGPQIGFLGGFLFALNIAIPAWSIGFGGLLVAEALQILRK